MVCMLDTLHDGLCADETNEKNLMLEISSPEHAFGNVSDDKCVSYHMIETIWIRATIDFENFRRSLRTLGE